MREARENSPARAYAPVRGEAGAASHMGPGQILSPGGKKKGLGSISIGEAYFPSSGLVGRNPAGGKIEVRGRSLWGKAIVP